MACIKSVLNLNLNLDLESGLRQTPNVNLYHVAKLISLFLSLSVHYFYKNLIASRQLYP